MYNTFNLIILEKQTFFENSLFMLPRQAIKFRESDKSLITVENYSINIFVKIKFYYPLRDSRNFQCPLFHYQLKLSVAIATRVLIRLEYKAQLL